MPQYPSNNMKYSPRQNHGSSRYQPYVGLAGRPPQSSSQSSSQSSTLSNSRPAKLTRCNAVIFDRDFRYDDLATNEIVTTHSAETTTSFDSAMPPPDTPTLNLIPASGTTDSTSSEVLSPTTSFKVASGDNDEESSLGDDHESCISVSPSIIPANFPPSINLPPTFKNSVRKAVQRRLKRYAGKLDPNTSREVELSIMEAIDLAIRILERSHRSQDASPLSGTFSEVTTPSILARSPPVVRPFYATLLRACSGLL